MRRISALLDANVLYPAPLRDLLMQLATLGLFRGRWTDRIHDEWINALLRREPRLERSALERTKRLMDASVADALVTGFDRIERELSLPDPDDRHVLAAAIVGRCDVIVTFNLTDFPAVRCAPFGIVAQDPDSFILELMAARPDLVHEGVRRIRKRLRNPTLSAAEYVALLERHRLVDTAAALRPALDRL